MQLMPHADIPPVFMVLTFVGVGLFVLAIVVGIATERAASFVGQGIAIAMMILGLATGITFGIITGVTSSNNDAAVRQNITRVVKTTYGLTLQGSQAARLLEHKTITLNDGRQVFLRHVSSDKFELRQQGPSSPLPVVMR